MDNLEKLENLEDYEKEKIVERVYCDLFNKVLKVNPLGKVLELENKNERIYLRYKNEAKKGYHLFYEISYDKKTKRWIFIKDYRRSSVKISCEMQRRAGNYNKDEMLRNINRTLVEEIKVGEEGIVVEQRDEKLFWTKIAEDNIYKGKKIENLREYEIKQQE